MLKKLYLIGSPVAHSISPAFHNAVSTHRGQDIKYEAIDIKKDELKAFIHNIKNSSKDMYKNCIGFNVTSPHKVEIMQYMDELDDSALLTDSVNVVSIENKILKGYNTDVFGFEKMMINRGVSLQGKSVVILGTGGAAKAVVSACHHHNASCITVVSRNVKKAQNFIKKHLLRHNNRHAQPSMQHTNYSAMDYKCFNENTRYATNKTNQQKYGIIINATPLGMSNTIQQMPLINFNIIDKSCIFVDLIYSPVQTKLLRCAKENQHKVINGMDMLMYQAIKSYEIWTGETDLYHFSKSFFSQYE